VDKSTIKVEIDKAKQARRESRAIFGRPGNGRKTSFVDKKKKMNKEACRNW
jgi:hypothetical protein